MKSQLPVKATLAALAMLHATNAVAMLVFPETWYRAVPGAADTGPFNHHLVQDVVIAFATSAAFLAHAVLDPARRITATLAGASFPAGHSMLHMWEIAMEHRQHATSL